MTQNLGPKGVVGNVPENVECKAKAPIEPLETKQDSCVFFVSVRSGGRRTKYIKKGIQLREV